MKTEMLIEFFAALVITFALTVLLARVIIPILKSKKMGQKILDIGPRWHKSKEGTPTMGGICFIIPIIFVSALALIVKGDEWKPIPFALGLGLSNGLIGLVDDYAKLVKKQNEGLLAWQKFGLQVVVAALYLFLMTSFGGLDTSLPIPFFGVSLELGIVYYIVAIFFIAGMVNSVNLTDGVDGLASSVSLVVAAFFAVVAFYFSMRSLSLIAGVLIGGLVGFLVYNFHPARVFMGDTGSLFLGGLLTGCAFMIGNPLIFLIGGLVFVGEAVSVILQVGVFKLSGRKKRLFKMAPIHHHFEQCGWSENKVVAVFSAVTLGCCALAWLGL